jgi:hypothetical protein
MTQKAKEQLLVSISGGRSSAMMAYLLETEERYSQYEKFYVFANTGKEIPETIHFLRGVARDLEINIHLIEGHVYYGERKSSGYVLSDWSLLDMDGKPFEKMSAKYGMCGIGAPHCTRELKVNPIQAWMRDNLKKGTDTTRALGMRFDEESRLKEDLSYIYPLADYKVCEQDVYDFFEDHRFDKFRLAIEKWEGNCDFCFKKSWSNLKKMALKYPNRLLWCDDMQEKYPEFQIYRGNKTPRDLINGLPNPEGEQTLSCSCGGSEDFFLR